VYKIVYIFLDFLCTGAIIKGMSKYFQGSLFPRIPEPSQQEVESLLEPYYRELWWTVREPWEDLLQRRQVDAAFRRRKGKDLAWWLHGEMVYQAETIFEKHDFRPVVLENNMFALRYRDRLLVTIKKLSRRRFKKREGLLKRSNYLTPTNRAYHDQRRVQMFPDIPRVVLGYETRREESEIKILIAYPRTQKRGFLWDYEIPDQSDGQLRLAQRPPDDPQMDTPTRGFTVTPKKDAEERGEK
jgi:hypothetical protein